MRAEHVVARRSDVAEVAEVAGRHVAAPEGHVGLRHVLGHVVEVVPAVVLLGQLRRHVEEREQHTVNLHLCRIPALGVIVGERDPAGAGTHAGDEVDEDDTG